MEQAAYVIKKMNLHVLSIDDVPESFSSAVYRLELSNQETVFLKIPYSKEKLIREAEAPEALKGTVPVPNVLDCWRGNEEITGALLLSCIQGQPVSKKGDKQLAYDIGVNHAKLHTIQPDDKKITWSFPMSMRNGEPFQLNYMIRRLNCMRLGENCCRSQMAQPLSIWIFGRPI